MTAQNTLSDVTLSEHKKFAENTALAAGKIHDKLISIVNNFYH